MRQWNSCSIKTLENEPGLGYFCCMNRDEIIAELRRSEPELRAAGVEAVSLFGSVARGSAGPRSDVDIAVRLDLESLPTGFAYFGTLDRLRRRLSSALRRPVDIVPEPTQREDLQRAIERDRVIAF